MRGGRESGGGPRLKFGGNEATNLLKALHFILPSLSLSLLLSPRNTTHPNHSDGRTRTLPKRISSDPDNFCHSLRCTAERRMTARPPAGGQTRRARGYRLKEPEPPRHPYESSTKLNSFMEGQSPSFEDAARLSLQRPEGGARRDRTGRERRWCGRPSSNLR